jgi:hypothetical protein
VRGAAAQEGVGQATFAAADALGGVDAAATARVNRPKDDLRHRERARERRATADCRLVVAELGAYACFAAYRGVMFFEAPPAGEEPPARRWPKLPPSEPPPLETGVVLALDKTVARSPNAVVRLPTILAFRHGCMLDVAVVTRQGELSAEDFWDLRMSSHSGSNIGRVRPAEPLPRRLLRLGVRYADGSKVTTLEPNWRWARTAGDPPTRPRLSSWPAGGGNRAAWMHGEGMEVGFTNSTLWLWPLPPAETFEFAVEWPLAGIDLTFTELDGAAIVAAAPRSDFYWPDDEVS